MKFFAITFDFHWRSFGRKHPHMLTKWYQFLDTCGVLTLTEIGLTFDHSLIIIPLTLQICV